MTTEDQVEINIEDGGAVVVNPQDDGVGEDAPTKTAPPDDTAVVVEKKNDDDSVVNVSSTHSTSRTYRRAGSSNVIDSSVFRFKDVNFVVGKGQKEKNILTDVSGTVKFGRVLAVMGPSGAGKTTLISLLTLEAFYGKPSGKVTLNHVPLTDKIFKKHCYVVKQHDKHWPYLTCRETLAFASELYDVADKSDIPLIVAEIITKMGLDVCADTRCSGLSGGQQRRLSIGIALLKQPTLLFLDEPTSGLDAAAAENIMNEIIRVAKEENLIIMCSIHQPSTKVYNSFDQLMILSMGRQAFAGNVNEATPYFDSIGYPLPKQTNPAEHFLDLVNADFSDHDEVVRILDTWEEKKPQANVSLHGKQGFGDDEGAKGVDDGTSTSIFKQIVVMFRRHFLLVIRDPILYLGRCAIFFVSCLVFSLVYWNARQHTQDQALNKFWISLWLVAVPSNMGVVAVYALNDEFKSILRESKNGMVVPTTYVLAKTAMAIPIMFIFGLFAIGVPGFAIAAFPGEAFGILLILWALVMYIYENLAEALSVWFDDPILGMLQFMNFWFACFLFGGFLISVDDLFWPFELFYHILPFSYFLRSFIYNFIININFDPCVGGTVGVCVESGDSKDVLDAMGKIYGIFGSDDTTIVDIIVLAGMAVLYKAIYVVGVILKSRKVSQIDHTP